VAGASIQCGYGSPYWCHILHITLANRLLRNRYGINFRYNRRRTPNFRAEADDQLQILEEGLVQLEREPSNATLVQALFRAAHTLKGSAGMIGHKRMVKLTHALETVLDGIRKENLQASPDVIDVMLGSLDSLHVLLDEVYQGTQSSIDIDPLVKQITDFAATMSGQQEAKPPAETAQQKGSSEASQKSGTQPASLEIRASIAQDSIASAARALQLAMALQDAGEILSMQPSMEVIETATPVSSFSATILPRKPVSEIKKFLLTIAELEELIVGEEVILTPQEPEPIQEEKNRQRSSSTFRRGVGWRKV